MDRYLVVPYISQHNHELLGRLIPAFDGDFVPGRYVFRVPPTSAARAICRSIVRIPFRNCVKHPDQSPDYCAFEGFQYSSLVGLPSSLLSGSGRVKGVRTLQSLSGTGATLRVQKKLKTFKRKPRSVEKVRNPSSRFGRPCERQWRYAAALIWLASTLNAGWR